MPDAGAWSPEAPLPDGGAPYDEPMPDAEDLEVEKCAHTSNFFIRNNRSYQNSSSTKSVSWCLTFPWISALRQSLPAAAHTSGWRNRSDLTDVTEAVRLVCLIRELWFDWWL